MTTDPSVPSTSHLLAPLVNCTLPLLSEQSFIPLLACTQKKQASRGNLRTIQFWYIVVLTKGAVLNGWNQQEMAI